MTQTACLRRETERNKKRGKGRERKKRKRGGEKKRGKQKKEDKGSNVIFLDDKPLGKDQTGVPHLQIKPKH